MKCSGRWVSSGDWVIFVQVAFDVCETKALNKYDMGVVMLESWRMLGTKHMVQKIIPVMDELLVDQHSSFSFLSPWQG